MRANFNNSNTVVANATNVGFKLNGIGTYSLNIIKELAKLQTELNFIVYLNKSCKNHINDIHFPANFTVKWASGIISPDKKFIGHLLRLIYSNYISLKHYRSLQFNTSQLEISFFKSNQIVMIHDIIPLLFKRYHKKQYWFFKLVLKKVLKHVKMVITPSSHTKELIKSYYGLDDSKIQVSYPGIRPMNINNFRLNGNASDYILYIGRINRMKNIDGIIRSFIRVSNNVEVDLVIVGDSKKDFYKLVEECNCSNEVLKRIHFNENVCEEEKFNLLVNASVFVYPTHYEGFGFPPLEAMQCGCPVIVSKNSSMPEVCEDAAYYVSSEDDKDIESGITGLLKNTRLRERLIKNGFENVRRFSWKKTASEHLMMMERILQFRAVSNRIENPVFNPGFQGREILD
jgi:glycosyltransferase involved in cell wall biosynthesis